MTTQSLPTETTITAINLLLSKLNKIMDEQKQMSQEYTYGRMTREQFIKYASKRSAQFAASWNGDNSIYTSLFKNALISMGHQANNTSYMTTDIS